VYAISSWWLAVNILAFIPRLSSVVLAKVANRSSGRDGKAGRAETAAAAEGVVIVKLRLKTLLDFGVIICGKLVTTMESWSIPPQLVLIGPLKRYPYTKYGLPSLETENMSILQ
jgi:hypothetical protein